MGSEGGGGGGGDSAGVTRAQAQQLKTLATQGSLYSLTLDEVQNQLGDLGKPLSSMNLDELLKTVCTVEASQGSGVMDYGAQQRDQLTSGAFLHRQSSIPLSSDLSKKTVDQVWQDIQQGQEKDSIDRRTQDRQRTLGEMTLEDFLVKAGVVAEASPGKKRLGVDAMALPQQNVQQQAQWPHYQIQTMPQPPSQQHQQQQNMLPVFMPCSVQQPLPIVSSSIMDATYPESHMTMSPTTLMGTLSDTQAPGRKRVAPDDVIEKVVERRQKRMIKNRESAARSRARKQAYTHELENKVSQLEEENERLKKQKEMEMMLPSVPLPEPKYQLRRTSSAPF